MKFQELVKKKKKKHSKCTKRATINDIHTDRGGATKGLGGAI